MRQRLFLPVLIALAFMRTPVVQAAGFAIADSPIGYGKSLNGAVSDKLFYNIGGGSVISQPATRSHLQHLGGLNLGWSSDLMCGHFDLKTTVGNQLNGLTSGFKNLMGEVIQGATGAVASLPAMVIQRANPGLYEMLTNGVLQAGIAFDKSQLSCQNMSQRMMDFSDSSKWTKAALMEEYKTLVNTGNGDAVGMTQKMEVADGTQGSNWIGGEKRGGKGQKAIQPIRDLAKAGFNMMNNLPANSHANVSHTQCNGAACQKFKNSEEAADAVVRVLGDRSVRTCTDSRQCTSGSTEDQPGASVAGTGFAPMLEEATRTNIEQLMKLVSGENALTVVNLAKLKTGSLVVTRGVVQALKRDPDSGALVSRLASELAMADTIETALTMRRMLMTGQAEPNAAAQAQAMAESDRRIAILDREIVAMKNEMELRRAIAQNTALTALEREQNRVEMNLQRQSTDNTDRRINTLSVPPKGREGQ
ncbi:integrating conjugative element protein [Photorhabdus heterorhabditis]|uniref:Integrating conjugative element protein n=1 Tax=Photorhabdus heterorhabditis TaxID=880156 RepID=A0A5B0XB79_9GAMM|nr:integrating conjugative element protein [Photorhabdus heterorhabditis]